MAFKKVEAKQFANIWNKKGNIAVGDSVEGVYKAKVEIKTKFGEGVVYQCTKENGEEFALMGTADIKNKMEQVPEGAKIKVTFSGFAETEKGSPMKVYDVEYDDGL